ncbi:MAG TPA: ferritin-like domain-containing protein [Thermoanaerobaculia bacterium]|jgi:ferritin-like metal-binding protein YciE|nr:ferritin-like domain-containing protein [Thermoanaerobaculia bacterium]
MAHQKETLIGWLNDAFAMEKSLVQVLENHANDVKDRPEMYRKISEHLEKTRMHAERVRDCVERLGGSTSSMKTALGAVTGFFQGRSTGISPDELVKNALSDYAAEHFEIASYNALIVAARALGEPEVARVCEEILRDEQDMARWLEKQLPTIVQEYLGQEVHVGAGTGTPSRGSAGF